MVTPFRLPILCAALALAAAGPARAQDVPPDDGTCSGAIAHWQGVAAREDKGGFMDDSVFARIQGEIDRASALCGAGQDAQARRAVTESMRRHGY